MVAEHFKHKVWCQDHPHDDSNELYYLAILPSPDFVRANWKSLDKNLAHNTACAQILVILLHASRWDSGI